MSKNAKVFTLLSLMFVLFLDGMGQGIVFPIYSKALFNPHTHLLSPSTTLFIRNLWYGILVGVFYFCWFLGAAVLSDLSDKSGRKKAIIICLCGSIIGNLLAAVAFSMQNIWILLLGRIIVGLTNGSQPIAQASIVDTSPKEKLSKNLGLIVMAVTLGLIFGPIVGGFLSDSNLVSWFSNSTPFYFAGIVAILNVCLLLSFYHETFAVHEKVKIHLTRAFEVFIAAFKHRSVSYLTIAFFPLQIGWCTYYIYISAYMVQKYNLTRIDVTYFLALSAVGLTLGLAWLAGLFEKRGFDKKHVVFIGFGLLLITLLITTLPDQQIWPWLMVVPLSAGVGFGYAFILTLFSHQVTAEKQGWVMGITSALVALAAAIASAIEGVFSALNLRLPLYIAIGFTLIGLLIFIGFKPSEEPQSEA